MKFCLSKRVVFLLLLVFKFNSISSSLKVGPSWSQTNLRFNRKTISACARFPINFAPVLVFEGILNSFSLEPAQAAASDAINLLTGYNTHIPDNITWVVLIVGAYMTQYRIFKFLSTL